MNRPVRPRVAAVLLLGLLPGLLISGGCVVGHSRQGGDNRWREDHGFQRGRTTVSEVLDALGPPVQVLGLGPRTAFFYLLQEQRTEGVDILGLFKDSERAFLADRAVYFFDAAGVLEEMAMSRVVLPREDVYRQNPWAEFRIEEVDG